jgi:hypothetical protein
MTKSNPAGAGHLQYGGCREEGKKKIDRPAPDYALEGDRQSDRDPSIDIDLQFDTGQRFGIHRRPEISSRLHAELRPR